MRILFGTFGVMLSLSALAVQAQRQNPHEFATNLSGVTTFAAPPEGFSAIDASDEELAEYGFPPRPDPQRSPKPYAGWAKAMLASRTRIVPRLERTNIHHGPVRLREAGESSQNGNLQSYNWSGYVDLIGATRFGVTSFYEISAEFAVPVANVAFGECAGTVDYGSSWVGIDGDNSNDVLQAGVEFDAGCYEGTMAVLYAPWLEWYPAAEIRIANLPVAPGDDYFVEVWNTSATQGYVYLVNENANKAATISFVPPAGTRLVGNSAEWITERPESGGQMTTLTNYIAEPFWNASGLAHNARVFDPGISEAITMYDDNNVEISYPTLLGNTAFLLQNANTAR